MVVSSCGVAPNRPPGSGSRAFFWFILAAFSVFFAEVLSGSSLFPFFDIWGYLALIPLYGLHALILFTIAFRYGRRSFATLFSVGLLFGLYEAFITKVIFSPHDGVSPFFFLEVDWLQYSVLVLWWHMFMAFIVPVLLVVQTMTHKGDVSSWLPGPVRRLLSDKRRTYFVMIAFLVWAGSFMGGNADPLTGPLAAASSLVIIYALSWLWKRRTNGSFTIEQLLPRKNDIYFLLAFLVVWCYLLIGTLFGAKGLPGIAGHAAILVVYALTLLLIVLAIRAPKKERAVTKDGSRIELPELDLKTLAIMVLVLGASISFSSATGIGFYVIVLSFLGGSLLGISCLLWTVASVVKAYLDNSNGK